MRPVGEKLIQSFQFTNNLGSSTDEKTSNNNTSIEIPSNITGSDRKTVETSCEINPKLCQQEILYRCTAF
jgi:hypothetical protein